MFVLQMVAQIFRLTDKDSSSDEAKVSTLLVRVKSFLFSITACCIQGNIETWQIGGLEIRRSRVEVPLSWSCFLVDLVHLLGYVCLQLGLLSLLCLVDIFFHSV